MRNKTVCFTGYRPDKLSWGYNEKDEKCHTFCDVIDSLIGRAVLKGYRHFVSGMALGVDTICAEAVLKIKAQTPEVILEAAVPCRGQENLWPETQKKRYLNLLDSCDEVSVLSPRYSSDCMLKRNRYMVDSSDVVIAVYDGKAGGTKQTLEYALKQGKKVVVIDPTTFQVTTENSKQQAF